MPHVKIEKLEDGHYAVWFDGGDRAVGFSRYTPEQFQALRLALARYNPGRQIGRAHV